MNGTLSFWKTAQVGSGGVPNWPVKSVFSRAALPWCSTVSTPGMSRTGALPTSRIRPRVMVDSTSQPWARSGYGISPA